MHPASSPPVSSSATVQDQQTRYYQYEPIPKSTPGSAGRQSTGSRTTRLLEIRRQDDGIIKYSLRLRNLRDVDAQYDAISYCWGEPTMAHAITVDGTPLRVTAAVAAMLPVLAPDAGAEPRRFWIDSICINQDDPLEKDQQIPLMRTIYRGAQKVVAYLGDSPDAALAADFVPRLAVALAEQAAVLMMRGGFHAIDGHLDSFEPAALPGQVHDWRALLKLLVDPYWSRTWIIQETVLAREIELLYGGRILNWDQFGLICAALRGPQGGLACIFLGSTPGLAELYLSAMVGLGQVFSIDTQRKQLFRVHDDNSKMLLPYLIAECCRSKATCPEDKVVGLLGLGRGGIDDDDDAEVDQDTRELLLPDHARTVLEVYGDAVDFALRRNCFALLNLAGCYYKRSDLDLPSWVPDLTAPPEAYPLDSVASKYKAGAPYSALFEMRPDRRRLRIYGWLFDEVAAVGSAPPPARHGLAHQMPQLPSEPLEFWPKLLGQHREAWRLAEQHVPRGRHPITGEECWRALCRTVVGDELPDGERLGQNLFDKVRDAYNAFAFFGAFMDWREKALAQGLDPDALGIPPVPELGLPDMMLESEAEWLHENMFALQVVPGYEQTIPAKMRFLYQTMARRMMLRSFAVTTEGHMMLVPPGTDEGDAVCIFAGAKTPFILRKDEGSSQDSGEGKQEQEYDEEDEVWRLYGEAYVHSMMDKQILGKRIYQRWFELR
ncbi:hypothetical protein RB595_003439 [Gaeumannomyces hyphopodioides]